MSRVMMTEVQKRGFWGWLFLVLFVAFNLLMLYWIVVGSIGTTAAQMRFLMTPSLVLATLSGGRSESG